jgi:N-acetyltransferase 10
MMGSSSVFISAPSPENLPTFFEFLVKGLDALGYREN